MPKTVFGTRNIQGISKTHTNPLKKTVSCAYADHVQGCRENVRACKSIYPLPKPYNTILRFPLIIIVRESRGGSH